MQQIWQIFYEAEITYLIETHSWHACDSRELLFAATAAERNQKLSLNSSLSNGIEINNIFPSNNLKRSPLMKHTTKIIIFSQWEHSHWIFLSEKYSWSQLKFNCLSLLNFIMAANWNLFIYWGASAVCLKCRKMQLTNERGEPKSQRERKSHGNHSQVCPIEIELIVEMFMYLHFLTRFYLLHVVSLKSRAATHL